MIGKHQRFRMAGFRYAGDMVEHAQGHGNQEDHAPGYNSGSGTSVSTGETLAQRERSELADLLEQVGPDEPTLCEGWRTRDLAAHLVVREHKPWAAAGMFIPQLEDTLDKAMDDVRAQDYRQVCEKFRKGAPAWSPFSWADKLANTAENFIHREDVRRGGGEEVQPRQFSMSDSRELWNIARRMSKVLLRPTKTRLIFNWKAKNGEEHRLIDSFTVQPQPGRTPNNGHDVPLGVISGEPGEVLLWVFGRDKAADLTIEWLG